jgi:hypothetical protein
VVFGLLLGIACGEGTGQVPQLVADAGGGSSGAGSAGASSGRTAAGGASASGGSAGASSGAGGTLGPDASPRAACRHYLEMACRRLAECNDQATASLCFEAVADRCPDYFFSPGSRRTVSSLITCASQWATFDCGRVFFNGSPQCAEPGTRQSGEACVFGSQCASLRCTAELSSSSCGTCLPAAPDGSTCAANTDCDPGLICVTGNVCAPPPSRSPLPPPAPAGAPCASACPNCTNYCVAGHACTTAPGTTDLRCLPLPGPASPCIHDRCRDGAYCASGRQCVELPVVGEPCAAPVGGGSACAPGTICRPDPDASYRCLSPIAIGEACRYAGSCVEGAECLRDNPNGTLLCRRIREEGETCSDAYDQCAEATACTAGRCVAAGELGIFATRCR